MLDKNEIQIQNCHELFVRLVVPILNLTDLSIVLEFRRSSLIGGAPRLHKFKTFAILPPIKMDCNPNTIQNVNGNEFSMERAAT